MSLFSLTYHLPHSLVFHVKATEELRERLSKLKSVYGSGIEALDNLAVKLDENSRTTFGGLNLEVSKHSHELENVSLELLTIQLYH